MLGRKAPLGMPVRKPRESKFDTVGCPIGLRVQVHANLLRLAVDWEYLKISMVAKPASPAERQ
jgi:hypothetical protein